MTLFEFIEQHGQATTATRLGVKKSTINRCYHGQVGISDRVLQACGLLPDFDRPATVLEWDRRRAAWLERQRQRTHKQPAVGESETAP